MLDTNTLIYLIKNKPPSVAERINAMEGSDALCMSFVSYAELLKGAERSTRMPEVLRRLDALVRQVAMLYGIGPALCEHYAIQATLLRTAGTPIGGNDLWIAGHDGHLGDEQRGRVLTSPWPGGRELGASVMSEARPVTARGLAQARRLVARLNTCSAARNRWAGPAQVLSAKRKTWPPRPPAARRGEG